MFRFFFLFKPTLSVGKVGGLAVDLLVSTYDAPRVGWLEDENVLPVVSNDALARLPRAEALLSTNLEGERLLLLLSFLLSRTRALQPSPLRLFNKCFKTRTTR